MDRTLTTDLFWQDFDRCTRNGTFPLLVEYVYDYDEYEFENARYGKYKNTKGEYR